MTEYVIPHEEQILNVARRAVEGRRNHEGLFANEVIPPERDFITRCKEAAVEASPYDHTLNPDTFPLHALFLATPTIYAGNSTDQFNRLTTQFDNFGWLFRLEEVCDPNKSNEFIVAAAQAYTGAGYNQRALPYWRHNASIVQNIYDGDLRNFFQDLDNDAPSIKRALMGPQKKIGWDGFHRFGPKIATLFLQWVSQYKLADLQRINEIGIPVDRQISRINIQTGGIELPNGPTHKQHVEGALREIYERTLISNELEPQEVSETLWLIGNKGCNIAKRNPSIHDDCPLQNECTSLISFGPLDEHGLYDPQDHGRFSSKEV